MLESIKTKISQFCNFFLWGIDPKNTTGFFGFIEIESVNKQTGGVSRLIGEHPSYGTPSLSE
jgi:hypothetical protein